MSAYRLSSCIVTALALVALTNCSEQSTKTGKKCPASTTQALQAMAFRGSSLENKQLALTFDDGPGLRTKQLSLYLKNEGIQATFFVNGKSMGPGAAEILQAVVNDGHLVANHTETHQSLTGRSTGTTRLSDADVVKEVQDTDAKIEPFVTSKRFLFRPPFGDYDDGTFTALSGTPMNKYVGPIIWDIGDKMDAANGRAADWDCWQDGSDGKRTPMKECGDLYIKEMKRQTRGIVLLHDPYFNDKDPEQLGTVDMVMYMVPILKQEGFTFVRADRIPEIAALLPPLPSDGADAGGAPQLTASTPEPGETPCP